MARMPPREMTRDELVAEVDILRAALDRADVQPIPADIIRADRDHVPAWLEEFAAAKTKSSSDFRERMLETRPDLKVFRSRPAWQRVMIRAIWRVQGVFGINAWVPRREREARERREDTVASEGKVDDR